MGLGRRAVAKREMRMGVECVSGRRVSSFELSWYVVGGLCAVFALLYPTPLPYYGTIGTKMLGNV